VPQVRQSEPPDFLLSVVALANFMRLSLMKAAHAALGGAPYRKSGNLGRKRWGVAPRSHLLNPANEVSDSDHTVPKGRLRVAQDVVLGTLKNHDQSRKGRLKIPRMQSWGTLSQSAGNPQDS
jgi:hypothetical protein